jgi:hypothetical protein
MTLGPDVNTVLDQRRSIRTYHDLGTTMNKVMDVCVLPLIACHDVMMILRAQNLSVDMTSLQHYFILNLANVGLGDEHADQP